MTRRLLLLLTTLNFYSCRPTENSQIKVIKFDKKIIDTLIKKSDTSYSTFIGRHDFYSADFYGFKKDSLIIKLLKDSLGNIVGLNKSKNGTVFFASEYYPNGQLVGKTQFKPGSIDGPATYYYSDGRVKSTGQWHAYAQVGTWKNHNETGQLKEIVYYDSSGNKIKADTIK